MDGMVDTVSTDVQYIIGKHYLITFRMTYSYTRRFWLTILITGQVDVEGISANLKKQDAINMGVSFELRTNTQLPIGK